MPQKDLIFLSKKIGLFIFFFLALYLDSVHLASIFPWNQYLLNILVVIAFLILYRRSTTRIKRLLIYILILSAFGEYVFSVQLNLFTYRLSSVPFYVPIGQAVFFVRIFQLSKSPTLLRYKAKTIRFLYILITAFSLYSLMFFNDVFGFVMTIGVFILLMIKPSYKLFFLLWFVVVSLIEFAGVSYGAWHWPDEAFGVFSFLPSHNPPSGISIIYYLLEPVCVFVYLQLHKKTWSRLKNIRRLKE
jgi:hypothetical protein